MNTPSNKALASVYFEYFRKDFGLDDNEETRSKFQRLAVHIMETVSQRDKAKLQKIALQAGWTAHKIDILLDENELPESYFNVNAFAQGSGHADPHECAANLYTGLRDIRVDLLKNSAIHKGYRICRQTVHEGRVAQ